MNFQTEKWKSVELKKDLVSYINNLSWLTTLKQFIFEEKYMICNLSM